MRQRGFTYVEVGAVIAILMIVTTGILPYLARMQRVREVHQFRAEVAALAGESRARAIELGMTVGLTYNKGERALEAIAENPEDGPSRLASVRLPEWVRATGFTADKDESPPDAWRVPFFLDGTSAGGGVELSVEDTPWHLTVRNDGRSELTQGNLPEQAQSKWQAGTYERR